MHTDQSMPDGTGSASFCQENEVLATSNVDRDPAERSPAFAPRAVSRGESIPWAIPTIKKSLWIAAWRCCEKTSFALLVGGFSVGDFLDHPHK
jgi:hypothetical protein